MHPVPQSPARFRLIALVGLLVLALSLGTVWYGTHWGLQQAVVEGKLQQLSTYLAETAKVEGDEAQLSYRRVEMQGWFTARQAVISDLSLELTEKKPMGESKTVIAIPSLTVRLNPQNPDSLIFETASPIHYSENGQPKYNAQFSAPVQYELTDAFQQPTPSIMHTFHLPGQLVITPVVASGKLEENSPITISFDAQPTVNFSVMPQSHQRESNYAFNNVKIAYDKDKVIVAKDFASHLTEGQAEDGSATGKYTVSVNGFSLSDPSVTSKAYNLAADMDYKGQDPAAALPAGGNSEIKINSFSLSNDELSATASGSVATAQGDPLPSGKVTLTISDAQKLLANELVSDGVRKVIADALEKITGQPVADLKETQVVLQREKSGTFYVGNITFEELAAAMLAGYLGIPGADINPAAGPQGEQEEDNVMPAIPENSN